MNELGRGCSTKTGGGTASLMKKCSRPNSAELKQLMPSRRGRICLSDWVRCLDRGFFMK